MSSLGRRMWGAARLHADTYEEVEADRSSIGQATLLVAVACAAAATGTLVRGDNAGGSVVALAVQASVSGLLPSVLWLGGSIFAYMVGATFLIGRNNTLSHLEYLF